MITRGGSIFASPRKLQTAHTVAVSIHILNSSVWEQQSFPSHRSLTAFVRLAFLLLAILNGLRGYLWFLFAFL